MLSLASKLLGKSAAAETHLGIIGCTGINIHNGLGFRYWGYVGTMEKKMETTIIWVIQGSICVQTHWGRAVGTWVLKEQEVFMSSMR